MSNGALPSPPADRYGQRVSGGFGRGARIATAVALAVAVALAAWFALAQHHADPVTADVVSFRVLSAEEVEVDFQVSMPVGARAACTVKALSSTFAEVGTALVPVGPAETDTARYTVTLRTSQLADAADVGPCAVG